MRIDDQRVLIIDCQTTGANPAQGNLLEIAWSEATAAGFVTPIETYLVKQPDDAQIPRRIQAITGLSNDDMVQAVDKEVVMNKLKQSLERLDKPAICLAHFARFESTFLRDLFTDEAIPFELLCTYEIAKRLYPNLPSKGIRAVAGYFGTTCGELKRAGSHVEATLDIWKNLASILTANGVADFARFAGWLKETPNPKRSKFEYPLERSKRLDLPDEPGVYRMLSKAGNILYVGKATSLKNRVNSYFRGQKGKDSKTKELLSQVWDLNCTVCETPMQAALLETDEIKKWDPPYNRALKRRQRALAFYSRDFTSSSETQDDEHPFGPFSNSRAIEPLLRLTTSIQSSDFLTDIFHYEIPKMFLSEGFQIFCINNAIEVSEISNARSLLALGLWMYRKEMRLRREEEEAAEALAAEALTAEAAAAGTIAAKAINAKAIAACGVAAEDLAAKAIVATNALAAADALEAVAVMAEKAISDDGGIAAAEVLIAGTEQAQQTHGDICSREAAQHDLLDIDDQLTANDSQTRDLTAEGSSDSDEEIISAETVGIKYERLLRGLARTYLRSKALTKLLHAQVRVSHRSVSQDLVVTHGTVCSESETVTRDRINAAPWHGLDVDTYDRMSVLLTEIAKAGAELTLV